MSENQNRNFLQYDAMTTEELEEILRLDAQFPEEQESDTEKILYIMEVLAQRNKSNGRPGKTAHEAYESFKQNYIPEMDHDTIPMKPRHKTRRCVRRLAATAAVLAILLIGSITAKAFDYDVWKAFIQWTQEAFNFGQGDEPNPDNNLQFDSFRAALKEGNVPTSLVPTWFPDGYELDDVKVERSPLKKIYTARYTNGNQNIRITIRNYLDKSPVYVEQSEGLVEEYERSGITYYLVENNERMQAIWIVDSYECKITGDLTIDTLKMMIDSIEKG